MILAIDFDGTLVISKNGMYGESETPNLPLIEKLIMARNNGHKLILWTCRGGKWLEEAIEFCKGYGLEFDAVNENIKGREYINLSCKVVADIYVDDKAYNVDWFIKEVKI